MADTSFNDTSFHERVRSVSNKVFWLGVAMVALGIAAVLFPVLSTVVVALMVGWMFLFFGTLTLFGSFQIHGTGPFFGTLLLSVLSIAAGVFLIFNPLAGAVALTLVVALIFSLQGAVELSFAFAIRPYPGWAGMLISGLISIALALIIAAGWPNISKIVLGTLLGVNFLSTGLGYILVSRAIR